MPSASSTVPSPSALRRRILTEASAIVADQGVDALTVRLVAGRSGCSTIGVYTHFGDKAGLVEAVLLDAWDGFDATVSASDDEPDPVERLVRAAHAYRTWALDHRTLYVVMFTPVVPGMVGRPAVQARGTASLAAHRSRIDRALATGALRADDPDTLATATWTQVHGWVMADLLGALPLTPAATSAADDAVRPQFETSVRALLTGFRA
ncbi:TetR family transcriptional regulator [Cellulomonas chitinilytica]|uniref:TetR family transcriptional regulator n=1 Tax=Cellulomonas chitinilytica TaxID=398759 RepID=A0A919TXI2_9CELL|nr:TetR/AcrR family transcriptional regulator [Cellulomonas chitinilytica]GIG19460.1 TetR family transcriptional regulator [Cellulomonas chitinilytica]